MHAQSLADIPPHIVDCFNFSNANRYSAVLSVTMMLDYLHLPLGPECRGGGVGGVEGLVLLGT